MVTHDIFIICIFQCIFQCVQLLYEYFSLRVTWRAHTTTINFFQCGYNVARKPLSYEENKLHIMHINGQAGVCFCSSSYPRCLVFLSSPQVPVQDASRTRRWRHRTVTTHHQSSFTTSHFITSNGWNKTLPYAEEDLQTQFTTGLPMKHWTPRFFQSQDRDPASSWSQHISTSHQHHITNITSNLQNQIYRSTVLVLPKLTHLHAYRHLSLPPKIINNKSCIPPTAHLCHLFIFSSLCFCMLHTLNKIS